MILGIEDITGGPQIVAFLVWLALSALFYLVCYMAAMQVIDGWTGNSIAKIPVMFAAAIPSAALMAALDYSPLIIAVVMAQFAMKPCVWSRVQQTTASRSFCSMHSRQST